MTAVSQKTMKRPRPKRRPAILKSVPEPEVEALDIVEGPGWSKSTGRMIAASPVFFAQEILQGALEQPYCGRFLVGGHHVEWDTLVTQYDRICVLAPRDHGKTFMFDFAVPLWKALTMPGGIGFLFSATKEQAKLILADIKVELETNHKLQHLVPKRRVTWRSDAIRLTNGHTMYARGYGTKVRGRHPHYIVCDDILNDETAYSEVTRKKEEDYFFTAVTNMILPGGQIIVIGCVVEDTWVASGRGLQQIGSMNPGDRKPQTLHSCSAELVGLSGVQKALQFWVNGVCPTLRVFLGGQFRVEGSYRHPIYVMGGDGIPCWRRSDELALGDFVALKVGVDTWGDQPALNYERLPKERQLDLPVKLEPDLAYLIGLWTAEGSFESSGRIMISNTEKEIRDWLLSYPYGLNFRPHQDGHTLRCSAKGLLRVLESLGAVLGTAVAKCVPSQIMSGRRKEAVEFLKGLFDGDGNVYVKGRNQQVMLGTVSERLARDVQVLLVHLGVIAFISKRPPAKPTKRAPGGGRYPLWVVRMTGGEAFRFMKLIGFRLTRKQACVGDMNPQAGSRARGIPHQGGHIGVARREKPRRARSKTLNAPPLNISTIAQARQPDRASLLNVVSWFESYGSNGEGVAAIRRNLEVEDLAWLPVVSIEEREAFTVDFVIEGDHSFVTNGIISHNTPFHKQDLYSKLRDNPKYKFKQFQALSKTGVPLWPDRYGKERLEARKIEIGPIRFAREFQCDPVSDDMSLFPSGLFAGNPIEQPTITLGMSLEFWQSAGVTPFMGVDIAMSTSAGADYMVIWVMGVDRFGNRWIIDVDRARGVGFQDQLSRITRLGRKYEPALIHIEANQMQRVWGDELIRTTDLPIRKFVTTAQNKNALDKGVPSLRVLLENAKFRIPRGDRRSSELMDIWIEEMRSFTWVDGKLQSVGGHDDMPMACWICDAAIKLGAFNFSFGPENDEANESLEDVMADLTGEIPKPKDEPSPSQASGDLGVESPGLLGLPGLPLPGVGGFL